MDSPPFFLGQRLGTKIYATKVKINLIHWHTKLYIDILNKLFFQKKKRVYRVWIVELPFSVVVKKHRVPEGYSLI